MIFLNCMKFFITINGDNDCRVFTVKTDGPLTFLKRVRDETTVDPKTLKFCYERLKYVFLYVLPISKVAVYCFFSW